MFICFLSTTDVLCSSLNPFTLQDEYVSVMEGSCVEIKCRVTSRVNVPETAYWFWIKDAKYDNKSYEGTIIYSSNEVKRPVSPQFKHRAKYTGSWNTHKSNPQYCSILICDVNKTDSGEYQFRFHEDGPNKWITKPATNLTVTGEFKIN